MPVITLTTDFGIGSPYVAVMKGVILQFNPAVTLVDITHGIPPQDVRHAAIVLDDVAGWFPEGTIHVAVIDPGVGTERGIILARLGGQNFVCPDNGLLSRLARRGSFEKIVRLTNPVYWRRKQVSTTFHGRDIMAPVAAQLSLGLDPDLLGEPQDGLVMLDWPEVRRTAEGIEGSVLQIDSFGNVITDITEDILRRRPSQAMRIRCKDAEIKGVSTTYGNHPAGTLIALVGSTGRLELAVVGGNAARAIGAGVGDRVTVRGPVASS